MNRITKITNSTRYKILQLYKLIMKKINETYENSESDESLINMNYDDFNHYVTR